MRTFALLSLAALAASVSAAPAAAAERYDGAWRIRMVKDAGLCDKDSFRYNIVIREGAVTYRPDPGDDPMNFSGQVNPGGQVQIAASRGLARVAASGTLQGASGSGTWRLPLLGCTGRWTAERTGPVQASR
jgi:hypothetical protein